MELGGADEVLTTSTSVATSTSVEKRQDATLSESSAAATTVTASTSMVTTATLAANPVTTSVVGGSQPSDSTVAGGTVIQAGPYSCTKSTDWTLLVNILSAHMVRFKAWERSGVRRLETDMARRRVLTLISVQ